MTSQTQNVNTKKAFDLHTIGAGYLYRLRKISVKKGNPYWCVTVGALHGLKDSQTGRFDSTYFDCRVVGELAVKRIEELVEAGCFTSTGDGKFENAAHVFVRFKVGDITSGFYWKKTENGKEPVPTISGRLLQVKSAKVKFADRDSSFDFEFVNQPQEYNQNESNDQQQANDQSSETEQQNATTEENVEATPDLLIEEVSQDDPDFMSKVAALTKDGYEYDEGRGAFVKEAA